MASQDNNNGGGWQRYLQPLMLVLLSSILALQLPLDSKRPTLDKEIPASPGIQLDARLWMDPFEVPIRDVNSNKQHVTPPIDFGGQIIRHTTDKKPEGKVVFLPVLVDGGPYVESIERRRRVRYAVASGLIAKDYRAEDRDHIRYLQYPDAAKYFDLPDVPRVISKTERLLPEIIPYEWFVNPTGPDAVVLWLDENQLSEYPMTKLRVLRSQFHLNALNALLEPTYGDKDGKPKSLVGTWLQQELTCPESTHLSSDLRKKLREAIGMAELPCVRKDNMNEKSELLPVNRASPLETKAEPHEPELQVSLKDIYKVLKQKSTIPNIARAAKAGVKIKPSEKVPDKPVSPENILLQHLGPKKTERLLKELEKELNNFKGDSLIKLLDAQLYDFRVIGPASSDILMAMFQDSQKSKGAKFQNLKIYSPTASIPACQLLEPTSQCQGDREQDLGEQFKKNVEGSFKRINLPDDKLVEALKEELDKRNVITGKHRVALIAEKDTLYGRTLLEIFRQKFKKEKEKDQKNAPVLYFTYFRGLDGEGAKKNGSKSDSHTTGGNRQYPEQSFDSMLQTVKPKSFDFSWGDDQIDYLRRIADEIDAENGPDPEDGKPRPPIRAIGLIGTDVYDKLLILQALRPRFPSAVFFTTELDARFYDGSVEKEIARNMVVASSFGLELSQKDLEEIKPVYAPPPFRSSEQTAYFLAIAKAIEDATKSNNSTEDTGTSGQSSPKLTDIPVLYEIGRTRAIDISERYWATERSNLAIFRFFGSLMVAVSLIILIPRLSSRAGYKLPRRWKYWLFSVLIFLSFVGLYFLAKKSYEPLVDPFEGISTWPTEFVRLAAAFLAFYFWKFAKDLEVENSIHGYLTEKPDNPPPPEDIPNEASKSQAGNNESASKTDEHQSSQHNKKGTDSWKMVLVNLPSNPIVLFLILLLVVIGGAWLRIKGGEMLYGVPFIPLIPLVAAFITCYFSHNKQTPRVKPKQNKAAVYSYLISAVCLAILSLSEISPPPARDMLSFIIDLLLLSLTVALFLGLLGTVLDAGVRLAKELTELKEKQHAAAQTKLFPAAANDAGNTINLQANKALPPPKKGIPANSNGKPTIATDPSELKNSIEAIGESTQAFFRLTLFPFIIAGLLLISRSRIFDNWPMPIGLALVFMVCFSLLIICIAWIRNLASDIRISVLDQLLDTKQAEYIRRYQVGAYGSILTGPTLGGLAILAGSGGLPDALSKLMQWLFG